MKSTRVGSVAYRRWRSAARRPRRARTSPGRRARREAGARSRPTRPSAGGVDAIHRCGSSRRSALARRVRPHEERDEVERRPVRPVQVLDDEHQRARLAEPGEHRSARSKPRVRSHSPGPTGRPARRAAPSSGTSLASSAGSIRRRRRPVGSPVGQATAALRRSARTAALPRRARPRHPADQPLASARTGRGLPTRRLFPTPASPPTRTTLDGRGQPKSAVERRVWKLLRTADEDGTAQAPGHALA